MAFVVAQISWWVLVAIAAAVPAIVIVKFLQLRRAATMDRRFADAFHAASDLEAVARIEPRGSSLAQIADVGLGVLRHDRSGDRELMKLNLERQARREHRQLERGLGLLSGAGILAVLIGLLGTIWGSVTGPVAQAIPAVGIGLAILIPSWLAARILGHRVKSLGNDLDDFVIDFLNLTGRNPPAQHARPRRVSRPQLVITHAKPR